MRWRRCPVACAVALSVFASARCANVQAPSGGPEDRIPPVVDSTSPASFARVEPGGDEAEIQIYFSERISERTTTGRLQDAITISPRTGEVEVRHRRDRLEVKLRGGFRPNTVYRIGLQPIVRDLFGNDLPQPYDFFFSTGPEFEPTVLAGLLRDRLTGEPVENVRFEATPMPEGAAAVEADTIRYLALGDDQGYAIHRYLPVGRYRLRAYPDLNLNERPDFTEPVADTLVQVSGADTTLVELALLRPDTTAANLLRAEPVDSITVRLVFDDALDPAWDPSGTQVSLFREEGEAPAPAELLHEHPYRARVAAEDSARAAAAAADTAGAAGDTAGVVADTSQVVGARGGAPPPGVLRPGARVGAGETPARIVDARGNPLPQRNLVLILSGPLEPEVEYQVEVSGIENVNGLLGGGGSAGFTLPAPPDTSGVAPVSDTGWVALREVEISRGGLRSDLGRPRPVLRR